MKKISKFIWWLYSPLCWCTVNRHVSRPQARIILICFACFLYAHALYSKYPFHNILSQVFHSLFFFITNFDMHTAIRTILWWFNAVPKQECSLCVALKLIPLRSAFIWDTIDFNGLISVEKVISLKIALTWSYETP